MNKRSPSDSFILSRALVALALVAVALLVSVPLVSPAIRAAGTTAPVNPVLTDTNGVVQSPTNFISGNALATTSNVATALTNAETFATNAAYNAQTNAEAASVPIAGLGTGVESALAATPNAAGGVIVVDPSTGDVTMPSDLILGGTVVASSIYSDGGSVYSDGGGTLFSESFSTTIGNVSLSDDGVSLNAPVYFDASLFFYSPIYDEGGSMGATGNVLMDQGDGTALWQPITLSLISDMDPTVSTAAALATNSSGGLVTQRSSTTLSPAGASPAISIDVSLYSQVVIDLSGASGTPTISFANGSAANQCTLLVEQGGTALNCTFPTNTIQIGGGGTTYTASGASTTDVIAVGFIDAMHPYIGVSRTQ